MQEIQVTKMKNQYIIGLNSGTSFDGIDVALIKFTKDLKPIFIDGIVFEYPKIIKKRIELLINNAGAVPGPHLQEISQLNFLLGELFAKAANKIIKKNKLKPEDILLIASHGQTIYHHPDYEKIGSYKIKSTLQLGESSVISERTGITTISNFREADIACGGQGAPLMPYLDWILFNKSQNIKAVLNIGGISNVTVVGKNIMPVAFDMGPGNALIDLISKKDFDKNGELAFKGTIDFNLIKKALKDSYFKRKPPKSTGKEYFNQQFIDKYFSTCPGKSLLATLTYCTAKVIEKAFRDFILPKYTVSEIVISGGGVKNKTILRHLNKLLPEMLFNTSDKYHLPSKYKEAILFALLGYTSSKGIKNNIPSCTGAKKKVILGKMVRG